jgi:hypothetical protein
MEWMAMPFGLSHASVRFEFMLNHVQVTFYTSSLRLTSMRFKFTSVRLSNTWNMCNLFYNASRRKVSSCVLIFLWATRHGAQCF